MRVAHVTAVRGVIVFSLIYELAEVYEDRERHAQFGTTSDDRENAAYRYQDGIPFGCRLVNFDKIIVEDAGYLFGFRGPRWRR